MPEIRSDFVSVLKSIQWSVQRSITKQAKPGNGSFMVVGWGVSQLEHKPVKIRVADVCVDGREREETSVKVRKRISNFFFTSLSFVVLSHLELLNVKFVTKVGGTAHS